ncbi:CaiB/BaiF CoA transferase family protein [Plastoroseomonas hellenica]|uniref:CaiB/BaiF CoA transferase family protein n=1 Tax=Plastoroseomonas hellenica TaxID=2687306 RepID=UPI001BA59736|nr:CoA transferase [Plastoroseomonas hellenica]MBR0641699.1 CoA transferase [Plastoroseomonas hellenica]
MQDATQTRASHGTLAGIRVLDLTAVLMGPFCTQILADHGAEVIKVEGPEGDTTRQLPVSPAPGLGAMFYNLNRGKRGLALDLKLQEGRAALLRLAARADVFIHAMRADAMARLGLTYADLAAVNPRIIYANVYGFSRRGPYAKGPAYDDTIQAMSGMAALQGRMLGTPSYSATLVADKVSGLTALYAVLMALLHRARTGEGQEIEVGMFETMANFVLTDHINGALFDPPKGEPVYGRAASPNRRPYRTADGWIAMLVYTDKQWRAFYEAAGQPAWMRDPRYATLKDRAPHVSEVYGHLAETLLDRTTADWLARCTAAEIPAAPVNETADLLRDPHLEAVGFFIEQETAFGKVRFPGMPAWFSRTPGQITGPAPALGQDGRAVLAESGFSEAEIDALAACGALILPADAT